MNHEKPAKCGRRRKNADIKKISSSEILYYQYVSYLILRNILNNFYIFHYLKQKEIKFSIVNFCFYVNLC